MIDDPVARNAAPGAGGVPDGGFAALVPELGVTSLDASLAFWCGPLGFAVAYDRPAAGFAYLARGRAQVMLCALNGRWEVAETVRPFGRGINLQMDIDAVAPIAAALQAIDWPLLEPVADAWYRVGDREVGKRELLVQDPDGYLLRFAETLPPR